ncbi:hypothetical protein SAMN04489735_100260 [Aneurinibacillus thermoaerophilus]|uniref:Uncharacterized protein n=1 Tax=Aneurinibacillus thermoaerophilus TaxID=143495 RepID=A0A1G7WQH7_ANETH|nr:hypothetical protein [Aneurinibacillus thermoaerophilus]SDG74118.1 hypothetical protein SAMN04489735_100260 [Aneurinibacillus thermoaerophilus]
MEAELKEFAESIEGQNMIILHDLGYKLADSQKDLTPLQSLFLIYGMNYRTKVQLEQINQSTSNSSSLSKRNSSVQHYLKQKVKERWKERGEL